MKGRMSDVRSIQFLGLIINKPNAIKSNTYNLKVRRLAGNSIDGDGDGDGLLAETSRPESVRPESVRFDSPIDRKIRGASGF